MAITKSLVIVSGRFRCDRVLRKKVVSYMPPIKELIEATKEKLLGGATNIKTEKGKGRRKGKMRKHNYCVGYKGEGQCAYGKDDDGRRRWINLLTLSQAKQGIKTLITPHGRVTIKGVIYKLVEVKTGKRIKG